MAKKHKSGTGQKRVVIGENMKRIKAAAKSIGAKWYQGRRIDPWDEGLAMGRNKRWILKKIKEGYEIIDIGIDSTRDIRSKFYAMGKQVINEIDYPIIPYDTI